MIMNTKASYMILTNTQRALFLDIILSCIVDIFYEFYLF